MEFTTRFELHSQTTRLVESASHSTGSPCQRRDSHPLRRSLPGDLYTVQRGKRFSRLQLGRPETARFKI
ncbi:hypothetical protein BS17DRAFT_718657 [Gyrodon lividus]|nr:hypothetical protein BS17DRAFT_718657 [Gyrodon lividus]